MTNPSPTPAGWYDDGTGQQRYWDGQGWTEHTADVAPAPATPGPADDGTQAPSGSKTWIWVVVGIAAIGGVGLFAALTSGGSGSSGEVASGDSESFEIDEDGEFSFGFTAPAGCLVIDVKAERSFGWDAKAELRNENGRLIDRNDDHNGYDPRVTAEVEAGRYELIVTGYDENEYGEGEIVFTQAGADRGC